MIGEAILFLIAILYIVPLNNSLYELLSSKLTNNVLIDFLFLTIIISIVLLIGVGGKYLLVRLDKNYKKYKVDNYMIGTSKIKKITIGIIVALTFISYYLSIINLNKLDIKVSTLGILIVWFLIIAKGVPRKEKEKNEKIVIVEGDKINPLLNKIDKKEIMNNINLVEQVSSIGLNKDEFIEGKGLNKESLEDDSSKSINIDNKNDENNQELNNDYSDSSNYQQQYSYNKDGIYKENYNNNNLNEIEDNIEGTVDYQLNEEDMLASNREAKEAEKLKNYKDELIKSRLRLREKQQRRIQEKIKRNKYK